MGSIERVAEEIRRYCAAHPHARDSLDGLDWWLTSANLYVTRDELRAAVAMLVMRGELVAFETGDGSKVYGLPGP